ncbi:MAG: carboxypeptidase M32 [Thermodesulfobacteriota bacterium]
MSIIAQLKAYSAEVTNLHHILALMQWDQEVRMPRRAAAGRAEQFATLAAIVHRKEVAPALGELLRAAAEENRLTDAEQGLVRVMRRAHEQSIRLPEAFVADFSRLTAQAVDAWTTARQESDFGRFAPLLTRIVEMARQKAEYLGYGAEPYDALLDLHEEGLRTAVVEEIFAAMAGPLQQLASRSLEVAQPRLELATSLAEEEQVRCSEELLRCIGFDFSRGCLARSAHPFSTTLGHHDRRVTNRYQPQGLEFLFGALHEGGHALYEQGIDEALAHSHLDSGVSLGLHESQSRLWENIIGRSRPFWHFWYPRLQERFPRQFEALAPETFYLAVNRVEPGLIRVDADEVTYNLHVFIRFELEKALLDGALAVADLPAAWNEKYRQWLGVEVPRDGVGVLQDIHWAHGSIGYFPTYTIGNLAAVQIWQSYVRHDPDPDGTLAAGRFGTIRHWLGEQIYRHGSIYPPAELLRRVTGSALDPQPFLQYLRGKYTWLAP